MKNLRQIISKRKTVLKRVTRGAGVAAAGEEAAVEATEAGAEGVDAAKTKTMIKIRSRRK